MAKPFDLKRQLKLHDKGLLQRLFVQRFNVLADLPWNSMKPHEVDPIVERWQSISEETRRQLEILLQDINELADERSQKVLLEDLEWRNPHQRESFSQWHSLHDKALWAYLEAPETFDEAACFARAEALRGGQYSNRWNSLPKRPIEVTEAGCQVLAERVRSYYFEKELRGDRCQVHHYQRPNGAIYFYTYLPEWADKRLAFDEDGNLTPRELKYAFHNVFIFEPMEGAIEIIAKGGKAVQLALRKAFCQALLDIEVEDSDPQRPCYHLDHLLDPNFSFITESADQVASVHIRQLSLQPGFSGSRLESFELRFREETNLGEVRDAVARLCRAFDLSPSQMKLKNLGIQLTFQSDGRSRKKTMTFHITSNNSCDLKSKPDEVRTVAERCVRRWRIVRD